MNRFTWVLVGAILGLCSGMALFAPEIWLQTVTAQEEIQNEVEAVDEDRDDEFEAEELEHRLNEIEELIERAEQNGNEEQIRELRREGERLLDRLEEIERSREGDDEEFREEEEEWEYHFREIELHRNELEIQRLHLEINSARQESALRLAEIASDDLTSASYAVSQAIELLEPEQSVPFLAELLRETENETIRRIIRHHLARLYRNTDQPDAALRELRALILEQ